MSQIGQQYLRQGAARVKIPSVAMPVEKLHNIHGVDERIRRKSGAR